MNRRNLIKGAAGALAASALAPGAAQAMDADSCGRVADPATFVLVPGLCCGGFVYDEVAAILRRRGHRVFQVTLTGLAERAHLLNYDVDLTTHIADVADLIRYEKLTDVVLAGHSYGGMPVTGVADWMPEKIASLVYLEAVVPENGQNVRGTTWEQDKDVYPPGRPPMTTTFTPEMVKEFGIPKDDLWRYTPHPIASTSQYIRLAGRQKTIAKKTFVRTQWANPQFHQFQEFYERFSKDPAWQTFRVQTGHMMMLEDPERVAEILEQAT